MSDKCLQKDVVFLGDSQDSEESNCKLFLNKDLSSKGLECTDPYRNLVDELNQDVVFPVNGQKNKETSTSNQELALEEKRAASLP
jgi:hypothetical protein